MTEELSQTGGEAQPLIEHLLELRRRFIWVLLGIGICYILAVPFA